MLDGGPVYTETQLGRFPVEPWNTYSEFSVLAVVLYWAFATKLRFSETPMTVLMLPVLFAQFIGAAVYHATRSHPFWLMLDVAPILMFSLCICFFGWISLFSLSRSAGFRAAAVCAVLNAAYFLLWPYLLPGAYQFYFICVLNVGCAMLACSFAASGVGAAYTVGAVALFSLALLFRELDSLTIAALPMGTHFLWHVGAGCGAGVLLGAVYQVEKNKGLTLEG